MADLPTILARPQLPELQLPRVQGGIVGSAIGQGLASLAEVLQAQLQKDKPIEAARNAANYDVAVEDLKNEVQSEPDPNKWRPMFAQKEAELRARTLSEIADPMVKEAFNLHVARSLGRQVIDISEKSVKASHAKQLADLEIVGDALAQQAASATDEAIRQGAINTFDTAVMASASPVNINGKMVPGALTPKLAEDMKLLFRNKVLTRSASAMILTNAPGFLQAADAGQFNQLGEDKVLELRAKARQKMDDDEKGQNRTYERIKKIAIDNLEAAANEGRLTEADKRMLLAGEHPYVTAKEARELVRVNDNPPSTESNTQVQAIMSEYYLGPRTLDRIAKTRSALQNLQRQTGKPNPLISKAANELQSDQTTMENQGIARENVAVQRENRAIANLKTEYDAWRQANPVVDKILGNRSPQERAQIEDTFRKQGPQAARALVDRLIKGGKDAADRRTDSQKAMDKALGK